MSGLLTHNRLPLVLLFLILGWGGYLRFVNLGLNTLASDEMNHFFVGQALEETGQPTLPSGTRYTRGIEYSRLVALSLPRFSRMEVAVRLPSAIIGFAALALFAWIVWKMAGPWASVFATALFAMYPEGLRLSRFGRFYTIQLLAGLVAFYSGWRLLRDPLTPEGFTPRRLLRDWGVALLTLAAFGYAAAVQRTTFSVAAGFALLVAIFGIIDLKRFGPQAWRWSVPWQLTILGGVAGLLILLLRFEAVQGLLEIALTVPMWARLSADGPGPISAYYRQISEHYPVIVSLSPLIFIVAILQHRRLGWFLLTWFAVPVLLHSVVFPWKAERYILLAVPALLGASGIAAAAGARALHRYLSTSLERFPLGAGSAPPVSSILVTGIAIGVLITSPAFNVARRSVNQVHSDGWAESLALLRKNPQLADLPIGSAQPLVALHYWGRLDFTVQRALLESWSRDSAGGFDSPYEMKPMGSPDVYAGRPTLTTAAAIRERFANRKSVLIGIDQKYLTYNNIDPSLRQSLEREATEICQDRCGSMRLFHWIFGNAGDSTPGVTRDTSSPDRGAPQSTD